MITRYDLRSEEFLTWWREGKRALEILEQHLHQTPFPVESTFSIADITLYACVHRAEKGGFDHRPYAALNAWLRRVVIARPRQP